MAGTRQLVAVFALGIVLGVAAATAAGVGFDDSMDVAVPSSSVTSACGSVPNATGWAAHVPGPTHDAVHVNRSIDGPLADSTLEAVGDGFRLALTTGSSGDCHYRATVALPTDFTRLVVTHDGEPVLTVENGPDRRARFWTLDG